MHIENSVHTQKFTVRFIAPPATFASDPNVKRWFKKKERKPGKRFTGLSIRSLGTLLSNAEPHEVARGVVAHVLEQVGTKPLHIGSS